MAARNPGRWLMGSFVEAMRDLGRPQDWRETVLAFRDEYGSGASRELAQRFGRSVRTAQKWLKGTQAPGRAIVDAVRDAGGEHWRHVAARALRNAQTLSVGRVEVVVKSSSKRDGTRPIGVLDVDEELDEALDEVAEALEDEDDQEAESLFSAAMLGSYSSQRAHDNRRIADALTISDYPNGVEVG